MASGQLGPAWETGRFRLACAGQGCPKSPQVEQLWTNLQVKALWQFPRLKCLQGSSTFILFVGVSGVPAGNDLDIEEAWKRAH